MKRLTSSEHRNNPLFLRNQFHGEGVFELPMIRRQKIGLKDIKLIGYDKTKPDDTANAQRFVHFFQDDYKFEVLWNDPEPRLKKLSQYKGILTPQFSTFYTMPVSLQIYNTFRSRWCGAYLQSKGLTVIPTVTWGKPQSYWYCFDGIEPGSVVALSTLGVKKEKDFFLMGYQEMLRRLEPEAILCYCAPFPEMEGNLITVDYAETNHLEAQKKFWTSPLSDAGIQKDDGCFPEYPRNEDGSYLVKTFGYVVTTGFGGGGGGGDSLPTKSTPNSVKKLYNKKGELKQERYYDDQGRAKEDIDYTNHGNSKQHPNVPHKHQWDWSNPDSPQRMKIEEEVS